MPPKMPTTPQTAKAIKPADQPRTFLTVKQVAAYEQCSEKTVRRAIAAGVLKAIHTGPKGRLVRIDPVAFAAYRQLRGDVH